MQNFSDKSDSNKLFADEDLVAFIKLLAQAIYHQTVLPSDVFEVIRKFSKDLDQKLSRQLNLIIHHADFKTLESSWRGLHFLVSNSNSGISLKIKMLHLTKKELLRDFGRSVSFDQSYIFKKIHDEEYGSFRGQPYSVVIGNYEFDFSPQDIEILKCMSQVAAESHAPFIASVIPERNFLSDIEIWGNYRWQLFREQYDAMYVSLFGQRILLRNKYGDSSNDDEVLPLESFAFTEEINSQNDYLWGNAAFACGLKLAEAFDKYRWCAAIEGAENGQIGGKLPTVKTPDRIEFHHIVDNSLDLILTDLEVKQLSEQGLAVLANSDTKGNIQILLANSCLKLKDDNSETLRNFFALPNTFAVSRFVHYLKNMVLNNKFCRTAEDWTKYLSFWIEKYCQHDGEPCNHLRPLEFANIRLYQADSNPIESCHAYCTIKAGYQLPDIQFSRKIKIPHIPIHQPTRFREQTVPVKSDEEFHFKTELPRPLVKIGFDVEIGGYIEEKELPFVAGVIGDFVGNPREPLPKPGERHFIEIDAENLDQVLTAYRPRVNFKVKNTLANDDSDLEIDLDFKCLEDFSADNIVPQIQPLQDLIEIRNALWRLFDRLDSDYKLEDFLEEILANPTKLHQFSDKINDNL